MLAGTPPATEMIEKLTSLVRQDAAKSAIPKIAMSSAMGSPKNRPSGLETQGMVSHSIFNGSLFLPWQAFRPMKGLTRKKK